MSIIKIDLKPYMENPSLYITENLLASLKDELRIYTNIAKERPEYKDYINEIEKDIEDVKKELKKQIGREIKMVEIKLKGSVQYISDNYYDVVCKKNNGEYVIAKVIGKCPYAIEQQIIIDCAFVDVDITGEYYELIVKEIQK